MSCFCPVTRPIPRPVINPVPQFESAASAWFWTCDVLRMKEAGRVPPPGPCRVEDVIKCLDRLYRHRRIELLHVRILKDWGWRGRAPDPALPRERCDARLWQEALQCLDWPLRTRGLVGLVAVLVDPN